MFATHKADQWGKIMAGAALAAAGPGLRGWADGHADSAIAPVGQFRS